jgi:hypothetical protein
VTLPGQIELVYRPPVSLFDAKILPPGAMFRFDFNWASSGINAFESPFGSLTWGTAAGNVQIKVNSFTFYKATVQPGNIQLPMRGVIDLCPAVANQYFANGAQSLKQNITLPSTCNRILLVLQDTASTTVSNAAVPANNWCGVGNGYNPATSFSDIFTIITAGTTGNNLTYENVNGVTSISQLWISLPELGVQEPNPIYAFNGSPTDKMRAYSDFCHIVQGTAYQSEGSIPYGSDFYTNGVTIMAIDTTTPANNLSQVGDPNNPQQYWYMITGAGIGTISVNSYNQTALWGWAGRCPGPIFAFPVVRPEGKPVSIGTLNMVFNDGVKSVTATLIASYSMAIVVELQQNG